jgi:hypothetical protein
MRPIKLITSAFFIFILVFSVVAQAADRRLTLSVKTALESEVAQESLLGIPVYMKGQKHPPATNVSREFKSNKRTNGFNKSDERACEIAFISAIVALQKRAQKEGSNAVIDIYSITKDIVYENAENYSCLAGSIVVNVALMGKMATIKKTLELNL